MKKLVAVTVATAMLSACATSSENVKANYISPAQYKDYDSEQLFSEQERITNRLNEVTASQDKTANRDKWAVAGGVILWPVLFLISPTDQRQELSTLKGQYEAINQQIILKKCSSVAPSAPTK